MSASAAARPPARTGTLDGGNGPVVSTASANDGPGTYSVASQGSAASGSASTTAITGPPRDLAHRFDLQPEAAPELRIPGERGVHDLTATCAPAASTPR